MGEIVALGTRPWAASALLQGPIVPNGRRKSHRPRLAIWTPPVRMKNMRYIYSLPTIRTKVAADLVSRLRNS